MNKRQLEVQQVHASEEEKVIRQLKQVYAQARKDCESKIRELSARTDMQNLQSIVYQKQYQEALKQQLDSILNTLNSNTFTTIADYLGVCYENGFIGTLYDLQGQGIPLIFPINQEEVVQALQVDSKLSKGLYKRLGEDTAYLKKSIRAELSRGASNGESWNQIAVHIANGMNSPFNKAYNNSIRIARTEGHRIQQESAFHCQQRAKSKGADIMKQWDSTLDSKTRPDHVELDGQLREIDEPFEVSGYEAPYPGAFGVASEDIHCRCCLLQRARWAISTEEFYDKWDGDKNELVRIKAKTYNEFKDEVKEVIHQQKIDIIGSFEEMKTYFNDRYGVSIADEVTQLDFSNVSESMKGIDKILVEFPQAQSTLKAITTNKEGVMCASYDGTISFNPFYYGVGKSSNLTSFLANATGYHPKNNTLLTTGSHEMGHILERTLIQQKIDQGIPMFGAWGKCTEAKEVLKEAYKTAKKTPDGQGLRNFQLSLQVSGYALENASECLAECVADYVANGEKSAILSQQVWKILKERLG